MLVTGNDLEVHIVNRVLIPKMFSENRIWMEIAYRALFPTALALQGNGTAFPRARTSS